VIDQQTFLLFMAGALLLNITPGPDMAFTLATSAKGGVRAGVAAALGVGAGSVGWAILTAAGLAALLAASEHALTVIRIGGGAYLLFLAFRTFKDRREMPSSSGSGGMAQAFRSGALTNLFNPKVGLFYLAFLPGFTDAGAGPVWVQILFLGAVFSFSGACVLTAVALAAGSARDKLMKSERIRIGLNTMAATVFGGLGLFLLLSRTE
jgi:threonine/homoserine/homoserine lactone efflux protein